MKFKKYYALLLFLGICYSSLTAQDIRDSELPPPPRFILSSNVLSFFGGNPSVNVSLEKPFSSKHGLELDVNYYFHYNRARKDSVVSHLNIRNKYGYGVFLSYKFLPSDNRRMQFFIGPTIGYRYIKYEMTRTTCQEVLPEVPDSGICECVTLGLNRGTNISRSFIAGVNIGFQKSYIRRDDAFFIKFHVIFGQAWIRPIVNPVPETVTCPSIAGNVAAVEAQNAEISPAQSLFTNHTFQNQPVNQGYISLNIKIGYAF